MARWRLVLVAFSALGATSACGREPPPPAAAPTGAEGVAAALNVCDESAASYERAVCATPAMVDLNAQISRALVAEAESVSDEGAQLLIQNQRRWLAAQRIACGVIDPAAELTAEQSQCLESKLRERAQQATAAVSEAGGYTFQTVEVTDAQTLSAETAAATGLGDAAPPAVGRDIRYPRIDNANTPQLQRFNQLVAQQPQYRLEDATEEQVNYQIAFAGPELISVRFDLYENALGAAHPNTDFKAVTVDMRTGQPLAAASVFREGSGWERYLTTRAMAALTAQFRDQGFRPPQSDVRDTVTKPQFWLITQDALVLLFPPLTFGGAGALGGAEVRLPWSDLERYISPEAPAPIRRTEA
ncbi:MAG: hypothetical protein GC189_08250 [Alphaproteobacteria bacterium]|nr:hypothetical protein [Alphaproteobacteria bacterium]